MVPVLEAVPNFSAGRDRSLLDRLIDAAAERGVDVLDASADPDHDRSVLTIAGPPGAVEEAAVALAHLAVEAIDLRNQRGVHPRIGALDVLPFVPLLGLTMEDARASARRVGERLAREVGIPVYFYAQASEPRGRGLAELRRGGFEALVGGFPDGRAPDLVPRGWTHSGAHPSAGAVCVGARPLLLAWNVEVEGLDQESVQAIALTLRESRGGFMGLRTLGLALERGGRLQISMNLEDVTRRSPFEVFQAVEARVAREGGRVVKTEIVGLIPDRLLLEAGSERLALADPDPGRVLAPRIAAHVASRVTSEVDQFSERLSSLQGEVPSAFLDAAHDLIHALSGVGLGELER